MIGIYCTRGAERHRDAMTVALQADYPDDVVPLLASASLFEFADQGRLGWDDLLIVLFDSEELDRELQATFDKELAAARREGRASRLLPISTRPDKPIPPPPLNVVKALPFCDPAGDASGIVRRVGALRGLWLRGDQRKIFVSHCQKDGKTLATQVTDYLKAHGYNAWRDEEQLQGGQLVQSEIEKHVDDAQLLLLLDTSLAAHSEWIWQEIDAAIAGFVPISHVLVRPSGGHAARSDFLALNDLNEHRIEAKLGADGQYEALSEEALAGLLEAVEDYLSSIFRLQMRVPEKVKEAFTAAHFDWVPDDHPRKRMFRSGKRDGHAWIHILSHCSTVTPRIAKVVKAFQQYHPGGAVQAAAPAAGGPHPFNHRLFIYDDPPLSEPSLARIVSEHGFASDGILRLLTPGLVYRFLDRYRDVS